MKKILLVSDGTHFSEGAFEFARVLNERKPILLTGVFLPQIDYANLWSYGGGVNGPLFIPLLENSDAEGVATNIEHFQSLCIQNNIDYRVHKNFSDLVLPGMKKETRFADLLIIGSETFYENVGTGQPNEFLQDALHEVECPVVVVPENYSFPRSNILAYDGSESSVYAIKQFASLLPELAGNTTMLVYVKQNEEKEIPDKILIEELAARHFRDLALLKLDGNPSKYFNSWLQEKKSAIVVSGSFSRKGIARLFHKSFAADIIQGHRVPVFIAH